MTVEFVISEYVFYLTDTVLNLFLSDIWKLRNRPSSILRQIWLGWLENVKELENVKLPSDGHY